MEIKTEDSIVKQNSIDNNPPHNKLEVISSFTPSGDQPDAISDLVAGLKSLDKDQVLLGVGFRKTFTVAHVIQEVNVHSV